MPRLLLLLVLVLQSEQNHQHRESQQFYPEVNLHDELHHALHHLIVLAQGPIRVGREKYEAKALHYAECNHEATS